MEFSGAPHVVYSGKRYNYMYMDISGNGEDKAKMLQMQQNFKSNGQTS